VGLQLQVHRPDPPHGHGGLNLSNNTSRQIMAARGDDV
jgi:hypothetical protein